MTPRPAIHDTAAPRTTPRTTPPGPATPPRASTAPRPTTTLRASTSPRPIPTPPAPHTPPPGATRPGPAPAARSPQGRHAGDLGQATTEYALVLLGAALVALLLVAWATGGGGAGKIGRLLDHVLDTITSRAG